MVLNVNNSKLDITTYVLQDHECIGMVFTHAPSLEHFRRHVINSSIRALEDKLNELNTSDDPSSIFLVPHIEELKRRTIEGYILTLQSMWERGLRGMLTSCESKVHKGHALDSIKNATWNGKSENIQEHFFRLLGMSIQHFSTFDDLNYLQLLGNAIRHGDGNSAQKIYQLSPSLWTGMIKHSNTPSFDHIDIPFKVLDQMMQSVLWFWEDIENIRCNSFKSKADVVLQRLSTWREKIDRRDSERVWHLG